MNLSCETIINENEKLKLSDLEKSCLNIFDYLRLHHNINFLRSLAIESKVLLDGFV